MSGPVPSDVIANQRHLIEVNLSENRLSALLRRSFSNLASLAYLNLAGNAIGQIDDGALHALPQLTWLRLARNNLTTVRRGMFDELFALKQLDLSSNSIEQIEVGSLMPLGSVEQIDLSTNHIAQLDGAFRRLKRLVQVHLRSNRIASIVNEFNELPSLHHVDLSGNRLAYLGATTIFVHCPNLTELDLSGNRLAAIHLNVSDSLRALKLDRNRLEHLNADSLLGLRRLERLSVRDNLIHQIGDGTFSRNGHHLRELDLGGNRLHELPWRSLVGLEKLALLRLDSNRLSGALTSAPFITMLPLRELILANNSIEQVRLDGSGVKMDAGGGHASNIKRQRSGATPDPIPHKPDNVRVLQRLQTLDLDSNYLQTLGATALRHLPQLASVSLRNNLIDR